MAHGTNYTETNRSREMFQLGGSCLVMGCYKSQCWRRFRPLLGNRNPSFKVVRVLNRSFHIPYRNRNQPCAVLPCWSEPLPESCSRSLCAANPIDGNETTLCVKPKGLHRREVIHTVTSCTRVCPKPSWATSSTSTSIRRENERPRGREVFLAESHWSPPPGDVKCKPFNP